MPLRGTENALAEAKGSRRDLQELILTDERQRLLADPRVNGAASDAAAALIEQSMPQGDQGPSQQGDQGSSQP